MTHPLRWHTGSSLWPLALADGGTSPARFHRPVILRFAGDDFMDRLQGTLGTAPARIAEFAVRHETWKTQPGSAVGWLPLADEIKEPPPKLYQPAHNRFYLVAGQFVCQTRGLPDRSIDAAASERGAFVLRRLVARPGFVLDPDTPSTYEEHGWFGNRQSGRWTKVAAPDTSAPAGEERLPMSPMTFTETDRPRRLMVGTIPVASREIYEGGSPASPIGVIASEAAADTRLARFSAEVGAELHGLASMVLTIDADDAQDRFVSLLVLFEQYLTDVLPGVMTAISGGTGTPSAADGRIVSLLENTPGSGVTWAELLANVADVSSKARFFAGERPQSLTPIGAKFSTRAIQDLAQSLDRSNIRDLIAGALSDPRSYEADRLLDEEFGSLQATLPLSVGAFRDQFLTALSRFSEFLAREAPEVWDAISGKGSMAITGPGLEIVTFLRHEHAGALSLQAALADADAHRASIAAGDSRQTRVVTTGMAVSHIRSAAAAFTSARFTSALSAYFGANALVPVPPPSAPLPDSIYVIRCVFDRPACAPFMGPVVGRPSRPFRLAAYYDPDAPVRPLRIRMPLDTTPEGLSKFPKGVSVILSDELRKQMARAEAAGLKGLMDGPGPAPPFDLGVICSLSIPIITICALILLMVVVNLLNIVFMWMPFFRICLPVPVKAK